MIKRTKTDKIDVNKHETPSKHETLELCTRLVRLERLVYNTILYS